MDGKVEKSKGFPAYNDKNEIMIEKVKIKAMKTSMSTGPTGIIITPSTKIESHILKNKVDDWLLINDTLKKKLFNIVYPLMTNNKILRDNKFTNCDYFS